jgi:thioesterase domain-containing protein/acyl carrier protein
LNGGTCVVAPERRVTPRLLDRIIRENHATVTIMIPTLFNTVIDQAPEVLSGLKEIVVGGEPLSPDHIARAQTALPHVKLVNGYGPTENTAVSTAFPIPEGDWSRERFVPIGRPIANSTAYVLDEGGSICPVGVPGELHVGGDGVARGYAGDPELTAERFVPDPFSEGPGARLYKTGDRCRYMDDGLIEYLGRDDHQIKIRGFRVELGEIETALARHPDVKEAVVAAARDDSRGGAEYLVGYVVPQKGAAGVAVEELKEHLRRELPAYMVPPVFMVEEGLPRTRNGKVDRQNLPAPPRPQAKERGEPPKDTIEVQLAAIWSRVLGVDGVGRDDDFFDLGGNSLLALRLFSEIEATLGRELPLASVFTAPTLREMASLIRKEGPNATWDILVPIQPRGQRPPFFCVHGALGNVVGQGQLAQLIDPEQPYFGIQAQGLGPDTKPLTSVESMARHYLSEVRRLRPQGPYLLGGYCIGAMIAHRMAQLLVEAGEEVPLLVLIDPGALPGRGQGSHPTRLGLVKRWLVHRLPASDRSQRLERAHDLARYRYWAKPYPGRALLFRSTAWGGDQASSDSRYQAWLDVLSGPVEGHLMETSHWRILKEPAVEEIGRLLNRGIEDALGLSHTQPPKGEKA